MQIKITIRNSAFNNCSALTSVNIPNNMTSIGSDIFGGCSSLTSVTIPDSVVMIGCYTYEQGWILNGYIDLVNLNVTAWTPLPEPYKEQNDAI